MSPYSWENQCGKEAKMGMGMGVIASLALETFKPEQIISWCRRMQSWVAGVGQAELREQNCCETDTLQSRGTVIVGVSWS